MVRVLLIAYEGKEKDTGNVFDKAEEYPVLVGAGEILPGLEEALEKAKKGEEKEVELPPEKAFGERNPDLVVLISEREFRKRGITPYPGLVIEADGRKGRVLAVSGGRVQVDFNHELAGKTVVYKVKILDELKGKDAYAALFKRFVGIEPEKVDAKKDTVHVVYRTMASERERAGKLAFASTLVKHFGVKRVEITEVYEKQEDAKEGSGSDSGQ